MGARALGWRCQPRALSTVMALLAALMAGACAPAAPVGQSDTSRAGSPTIDDTLTLVIATRTEPKALVASGLNLAHSGSTPDAPWQLFHASLVQTDEHNAPQAQLAESFPILGTDSWKVSPDGRMEMTWRLRKGLSWHDGAPLSAEDFLLSFQFQKSAHPDSEAAEAASAPDEETFVVFYPSPLPGAAEVIWQPLPRHILGPTLQQLSPQEAFDTLSYWNTEFVGVGPYRLERWEPGAFITGVAFPGYAGGRPRIGRVQLVWISDPNTAVANLQSSAVHLATDRSLTFEQVPVLRRDWAASPDSGAILLSAARAVFAQPQFRPEYVRPALLLDPRFRQALAHAIDKQAIVDVALDGEPGAADTVVPRDEEFFPALDRALTKYPLDLRRSEQLFAELGLQKDGDGVSRQGERVAVGMQVATGGGGYLREALVLADNWKRAGVEAALRTLSAAEQSDQELAGTYPGVRLTQLNVLANPFLFFTAATVASPANRWSGRNKGGFVDPEVERLAARYLSALDRTERSQALIQGMAILSQQAAYFPLYYGYDVIAHSGRLLGPRGGRQNNALRQIETWRWKV
jgi:peptide/nickel transport system substrate-binding protein